MDSLVIRQVVDPLDPAIAGFGQMQQAAYFAPETLIPARFIPPMLGDVASARRNFLVVAEFDGRVVGGTLFHWLDQAGSGFSSFLGVERALRGRSIARQMHERRFSILDQAAGGRTPGVFIDVVSPIRMPPQELERERSVGSDPVERRRAFAHVGFRQVDIRYEQPVGGPNGGPVTILDLLFCPHEPAETISTTLVVATMQAYWTPWLGPAEARHHARELEDRAQGAALLALISPEPLDRA
ncbi:MAG: GNAT family N-acetyltransferase [Chloroflexi bacterium]|nr:GNAT family N-acetyltransferase [Chloroflexota bacterium]